MPVQQDQHRCIHAGVFELPAAQRAGLPVRHLHIVSHPDMSDECGIKFSPYSHTCMDLSRGLPRSV